jgi:hypothetical protein
MKRIFTLFLLAATTVVMAVPAQADHANHTYFDTADGDYWNESVNRSICMSSEFSNGNYLTTGEYLNAYDTAANAIGRWETNTDVDNIFSMGGSCGDFNFINEWDDWQSSTLFCSHVPDNRPSSFQLEDFRNSTQLNEYDLAISINCNRDPGLNNRIDFTVIVVNRKYVNDFAWSYLNNPTSARPYDFHGLVMHEFGHSLGWDGYATGHLLSPCSHVTPETDFSTMCDGSWGLQMQTYDRTLESHDIAGTNAVWP